MLDFSKTFDKVSHALLVHKLKRYGVGGLTGTWIEDFLLERQQAVLVEGATSEYAPVESGVPQGSFLGPSLFLIYINDLPSSMKTQARLFADDTMCSNEIQNTADQDTLQADLDSLAEWETKWAMEFHPAKCSTKTLSKQTLTRLLSGKPNGLWSSTQPDAPPSVPPEARCSTLSATRSQVLNPQCHQKPGAPPSVPPEARCSTLSATRSQVLHPQCHQKPGAPPSVPPEADRNLNHHTSSMASNLRMYQQSSTLELRYKKTSNGAITSPPSQTRPTRLSALYAET